MKEKSTVNSSWKTHIDSLKQYYDKIENPSNQTITDGNEIDISTGSIVEMISILQKTLLEGLAGIARLESIMNANSSFHSFSLQYAEIKEVNIYIDICIL